MEPVQPALRYNEGKLKWSLVHFKSLEPMVRVLMYGAEKYTVRDATNIVIREGAHQWKDGLKLKEIEDSMLRHATAIVNGELLDPESGLPHIGHLMCNAMFWEYTVQQELGLFNTPPRNEAWDAFVKKKNPEAARLNVFTSR